MAQDKRQVDAITARDVDFCPSGTPTCAPRRELSSTTPPSRACSSTAPYGYAIWENIQKELDKRFKETGHENVYLPMLIPESLLQKEKDHVEGFAPECAWVTVGGSEKLEERCCIRPTSETLFCEHYKNIIHSHRDLPKLLQPVVLRPALGEDQPSLPPPPGVFCGRRGHTMHATEEEAREETTRMLNIYADFLENVLAMPVCEGAAKTDKEKFNGAEETYTVECMMHDKKALQAGTSHYFGDGFARALRHHLHRLRQPTPPPPPDLLGRVHPDDRRHHHDPRRRQRPGAAPPDRPHPGDRHPRGPAQARGHRRRPGPPQPSPGRRGPGQNRRER